MFICYYVGPIYCVLCDVKHACLFFCMTVCLCVYFYCVRPACRVLWAEVNKNQQSTFSDSRKLRVAINV